MRTFAIAVILFIVGFLAGFTPQHLKANQFQEQVRACDTSLQLAHVRQSAALLYLAASELNYGIASQRAADFFNQVQSVANNTTDGSLRKQMQNVLASRDKITTALAKGDAQVMADLQSVVAGIEEGPSGQ